MNNNSVTSDNGGGARPRVRVNDAEASVIPPVPAPQSTPSRNSVTANGAVALPAPVATEAAAASAAAVEEPLPPGYVTC